MEAGVILVGIDFSDASAVAAERAREIARASGTGLVALHVADREGWCWTPERVDWVAARGIVPGQVIVRTGLPWLQLTRFADEIRPAMLVVGSHGAGGFHPVAPGSTATMLLTRVRVPVLVVPPRNGRRSPAEGEPFSTERNPT